MKIAENKQSHELKVIKTTNSGKFLDVVVAPNMNSSVTIGQDGSVRLWDYVNKAEYYNR